VKKENGMTGNRSAKDFPEQKGKFDMEDQTMPVKNDLFWDLFENSPDGIFLVDEGVILECKLFIPPIEIPRERSSGWSA